MDLYGYRQIEVDIGGVNDVVPPVVLSAGDHDGRVLLVRLWDGAAAASPTGLTARLLYNSDPAKGSGGYVTMSAVSGEPTAAWRVAVPTEVLAPGRSVLSVEISEGETIVASRRITAYVEPSVIDDGAPEAVDALAEFRAAIARLEDFTLPVTVEHGGTGSTTVAAARNVLGLGNTSGALPVANGGTGQTTVAAARNALGLGNTSGALPVANGGTGSTSAADARTALGAVAKAGDTMTGHLLLSGKELQPKASLLKDGSTDDLGNSDGAIDFLDKESNIIGIIRPSFDLTAQWLSLYPRRKVGNAGKINELRLGLDANGNALVAFSGTGAQAAWLSALGLPSGIDAAAWLSALGIATTPSVATGIVTLNDSTRFTITGSTVRVLNGIAEIEINLTTKVALTAFTRYGAMASIAEGYRPVGEQLIGGIMPVGAALGNISSTGAVSFYPLQAIAADKAINLRGTYILA